VLSQLIEQHFGIRLAARTMRLYLERWGLMPQKPMRKAYEHSAAALKKWLDEDYPDIAQRAKAEGAQIHWGDESGLRSDDVPGRSYAPKRETPVVQVLNKRHGLSIICTFNNKEWMRYRICDGALNLRILIDFFKRLIKGQKKKVLLILDNFRTYAIVITTSGFLSYACRYSSSKPCLILYSVCPDFLAT
jgi:Winged helix-turn helix/DDE superfamily endonuclease